MTRVKQGACLFALFCASAGMSWGATPDDCHLFRKHGRLPEAKACYQSLTESAILTREPKATGGLGLYDAGQQRVPHGRGTVGQECDVPCSLGHAAARTIQQQGCGRPFPG